jgi:hypothetical protein
LVGWKVIGTRENTTRLIDASHFLPLYIFEDVSQKFGAVTRARSCSRTYALQKTRVVVLYLSAHVADASKFRAFLPALPSRPSGTATALPPSATERIQPKYPADAGVLVVSASRSYHVERRIMWVALDLLNINTFSAVHPVFPTQFACRASAARTSSQRVGRGSGRSRCRRMARCWRLPSLRLRAKARRQELRE